MGFNSKGIEAGVKNYIRVSVKENGRFKAPVLDGGQLTRIGKITEASVKKRMSQGINADGNRAKPLSKKYMFIKQYFTGVNRPIRDMKMTGLFMENFTLRKAVNNQIRIEPTSRAGRQHASQAEKFENMIGFSGPDQVVVAQAAQVQYGEALKSMWVRVQ